MFAFWSGELSRLCVELPVSDRSLSLGNSVERGDRIETSRRPSWRCCHRDANAVCPVDEQLLVGANEQRLCIAANEQELLVSGADEQRLDVVDAHAGIIPAELGHEAVHWTRSRDLQHGRPQGVQGEHVL
eukprot:2890719-Rhodomonas_salina.1